MTELLEQVFKKASALPLELQDALAREFLQEIEWENRWDKTLGIRDVPQFISLYRGLA
jgi:hypothetical protein